MNGDPDVCGRDFSFALNNLVACCMQPDWRNRPNAMDLAKEVHREMLQRARGKAKRGEEGGVEVLARKNQGVEYCRRVKQTRACCDWQREEAVKSCRACCGASRLPIHFGGRR